jgi:hypothetical protein
MALQLYQGSTGLSSESGFHVVLSQNIHRITNNPERIITEELRIDEASSFYRKFHGTHIKAFAVMRHDSSAVSGTGTNAKLISGGLTMSHIKLELSSPKYYQSFRIIVFLASEPTRITSVEGPRSRYLQLDFDSD